MNRFLKQIAIVALAITTAGIFTATQAHAERHISQSGHGISAIGIIALNRGDHRYRSSPRHVTRSYGYGHHRGHSLHHRLRNHHVGRHHDRHFYHRRHHSRYRH